LYSLHVLATFFSLARNKDNFEEKKYILEAFRSEYDFATANVIYNTNKS
jgi:hypothetical protein